MVKIFYEEDCNLDLFKDKIVVVIGFGSQGYVYVLNLRDFGINVVVGFYYGSKFWVKVESYGFKVMIVDEVIKVVDVIMIFVNDEKQLKLFKESIELNLKEGKVIVFVYGFNIYFGQIVLLFYVDVIMIVLKGLGYIVRSQY